MGRLLQRINASQVAPPKKGAAWTAFGVVELDADLVDRWGWADQLSIEVSAVDLAGKEVCKATMASLLDSGGTSLFGFELQIKADGPVLLVARQTKPLPWTEGRFRGTVLADDIAHAFQPIGL